MGRHFAHVRTNCRVEQGHKKLGLVLKEAHGSPLSGMTSTADAAARAQALLYHIDDISHIITCDVLRFGRA